MKEQIIKVLETYFNSVYCDSCKGEYCDECNRKSMNWEIGHGYAEDVANEILKAITTKKSDDIMKTRGFEIVKDEYRQHPDANIVLPTRADIHSAGYDFYCPITITLQPAQKTLFSTDVKAYMQDDEVLEIYIRSSLGIKKGLMIPNNVGIIDSSYYNNPSNDGNIGMALVNTSGKEVTIKAGERVAQGIFKKYLVTDNDNVLALERTGGFGSSGV